MILIITFHSDGFAVALIFQTKTDLISENDIHGAVTYRACTRLKLQIAEGIPKIGLVLVIRPKSITCRSPIFVLLLAAPIKRRNEYLGRPISQLVALSVINRNIALSTVVYDEVVRRQKDKSSSLTRVLIIRVELVAQLNLPQTPINTPIRYYVKLVVKLHS